jgi:hypothetical protein
MTTKRNTFVTRRRSLAVTSAALAIGLLSAVPASAGTLTPQKVSFGDQAIGTQSVAVEMEFRKEDPDNSGHSETNSDRYVATIEFNGSFEDNFEVVYNTCAPPAAPAPETDRCQVGVVFAPQTVGSKSARLRVEKDEFQLHMDRAEALLTGEGKPPPLAAPLPVGTPPIVPPSISPALADFGSTIVGTHGNIKPFLFSAGTGAGNPSVQDVGLFPSTHYKIIGDSCTGKTLAKGATCWLYVRFTPGSLGLKLASLLVANGQGQASSTLTGTGIPRPIAILLPG